LSWINTRKSPQNRIRAVENPTVVIAGIQMDTDDTIVALSTSQGSAALAVIRVSGPDAISTIKEKVDRKEKFDNLPPNVIALFKIRERDTKEVIDEVTIVKYISPNSYTGENMVEIICHGGTVIVERILESLIDEGLRYAKKGEFTKRAFCNGKADIIKAESINQMIKSTSVIQQKNAIQSYIGGYESRISGWKRQVEDILVEVESEIEFNDDDDIAGRESKGIIKERVEIFKKSILSELKKRDTIKEVEKGISVVIVGPRNAGKSSLFNLILGFERSIVDVKKGTTRDFVSEERRISSVPVTFIDTAGLAETEKSIEKEGVQRTKDLIKKGNIIVWVTAADEEIKNVEREIKVEKNQKILGVINKIDLSDGIKKENMFKNYSVLNIKISATDKNERGKAEKFIVDQIAEMLRSVQYDCIISNKRQERIIEVTEIFWKR
jgi:tRNA modification GTPase